VKVKKHLTPYWRTLKSGGVINEKYPGGAEEQKKLLEKEGQRDHQKGKKSFVVDFEESLSRYEDAIITIRETRMGTPPVRKRIAVFAEGPSRNF
jgi:hypothetical protein